MSVFHRIVLLLVIVCGFDSGAALAIKTTDFDAAKSAKSANIPNSTPRKRRRSPAKDDPKQPPDTATSLAMEQANLVTKVPRYIFRTKRQK